MTNCPEDEVGLLSSCPNCEKYSVNKLPPHRNLLYWIGSVLAHAGIFLLTLLMFNASANSKFLAKCPIQNTSINHEKHLVGTFACGCLLAMVNYIHQLIIIAPMNNHASYKIETRTLDDWNAHLFFGEPSYDSDIAWNKLIRRERSTTQTPCYIILI